MLQKDITRRKNYDGDYLLYMEFLFYASTRWAVMIHGFFMCLYLDLSKMGHGISLHMLSFNFPSPAYFLVINYLLTPRS
jgi:hypothetical protein